jgi:hypothetical protein
VSQRFKASAPPAPDSIPGNNGQAFEASIRQLIANGKFKAAVESAKEFHKLQHSPASEAVLLDAYAARIQSLLDQNLAPEAKSLLELVCQRFPSAKARLERSMSAVSARVGDLAALLQPLSDPQINPERRAEIEQIILTQLTDLTALAACDALPPEHSLRRAAGALDVAFTQVTTAPVTNEQIALPEVSYRSPLAAWKLLVRAIAFLYRGDDEACRECIAAIKPESVPHRLVPAIQAILGMKTPNPLKPGEAGLVSLVSTNMTEFRAALVQIDRLFANEYSDESQLFKAVRTAVRDCQRCAPDRVQELKQILYVRGEVALMDTRRMLDALGGEPRRDAQFFRVYALALEASGDEDEEDLARACEQWSFFRQQAINEGVFRADSIEAAILFLHMAEVLERIPKTLLKQLQQESTGQKKGTSLDSYFLFPDELYTRASIIDPHPEVFSKWMRWAATQSVSRAELVCKVWRKSRPDDIEPLLYLMRQAEKRSAFPTALSYLAEAERIDAVHSEVRSARLRLLAANVFSHLQKKKPHLAAEKLAQMASLPQSQQGDRPGLVAVLRHLTCVVSGDSAGAAAARKEAEGLLGDTVTASILIFSVAQMAKCTAAVSLPPPKSISKQDRKSIPLALARLAVVVKDLGLTKLELPVSYLVEAEAQFADAKDGLNVNQLVALAEMGEGTKRPKFTWMVTTEGLTRGGPTEARFLLMRANACRDDGGRSLVMAAGAVELGRFHRDSETVDKAVEAVRSPSGKSFSITLDQAREVVRKELSSPAYPNRYSGGPDYSQLLPAKPPCNCPECRRARNSDPVEAYYSSPDRFIDEGEEDEIDEDEFAEPDFSYEPQFSEAEIKKIIKGAVPGGIPPEIANELFEVMKESFLTGERPESILERIMGGKKKKAGRK